MTLTLDNFQRMFAGVIAAVILALSAMVAFAPQVSAAHNEVHRGCELTGTCAGGESDITSVITTVVDILSLIVGAVSVIMIIIGGLRYITSGGDSGNVASAKNTIIYAIVGLVIVLFAQIIVNFVITETTT